MKYFSIGQQWVLFFITLLLLGSFYYKFSCQPPSHSPEQFLEEFVVEVSGEVRQPGTFIFQTPPTLGEAIKRAGGLKKTAQLDTTSFSEILETGTLLIVTKGSSQISPSPPSPREGNSEMKQEEIKIRISRMAANKLLVFSLHIDLNRVSFEDLCLIPGIGETLAREMIAYRERRRGFRSVEEIKNVRGIGEKKYQSLKGFFIIKPDGAFKR
jgi:competence protein ComEA